MTRNTIARLVLTITIVVACGAHGPALTSQQSLRTSQCLEPVPSGFSPLNLLSLSGPWVFDESRIAGAALPALENASGLLRVGPIRVRLDDGSEGVLRVVSGRCAAPDDCSPLDCGCPLDSESFWIEITSARGALVSRLHLRTAYGNFQIVPVDLIDGAGDELLIIRVPAHASPPVGYDLKIWKVGATKPVELGSSEWIAGVFVTDPIGCARWRTRLFIDLAAPKPRPFTLRTQLGATGCCQVGAEEAGRATGMRTPRALRFDAALGGYRE